jgi:hypothetical protein
VDFARAILTRWGHPAAPPSPEPGETRRLAFDLHRIACNLDSSDPVRATLAAAATLLAQPPAPAPVVVPVPVSERLPEPEDCDDHQECWAWDTGAEWWILEHYENCKLFTHWLPAHAIPLPQAENPSTIAPQP